MIDGGSQDGTVEIIKKYQDRIAYWISEKDMGQSHALNKGFRSAGGEILSWLNSDDCYFPWSLWRVALAFDLFQPDMVAGGCALRIDRNPVPWKKHRNALPIGKVVPLPLDRLLDIDGSWLKGDFFYQPEVFWSREIWDRSGGSVAEDLYYSMDYELWLRFAHNKARIVHIPDTLTLFRMHDNQKTSGDIPYLPELYKVSRGFQERTKSNYHETRDVQKEWADTEAQPQKRKE